MVLLAFSWTACVIKLQYLNTNSRLCRFCIFAENNYSQCTSIQAIYNVSEKIAGHRCVKKIYYNDHFAKLMLSQSH